MNMDELREKLANHEDVGVALRINRALGELISEGKLAEGAELTLDALGVLRRKLYDLKPDLGDLLGAFCGRGTGNPGEAALQYIEDLMG